MAKHAFDLKTLARIGAASRLKQLELERAQILKAFPAFVGPEAPRTFCRGRRSRGGVPRPPPAAR